MRARKGTARGRQDEDTERNIPFWLHPPTTLIQDTIFEGYECLEKPMASFEVSEPIGSDQASVHISDSDSDGDVGSYTSFLSLDNHPELFTEGKSWVDFHTNHDCSRESGIEETWEKGRLRNNSDILRNKLTEVDQIWKLEESRVWNNYFSRRVLC
jgi:hypothetical protein